MDDHPVVREGIKAILDRTEDIAVIGEASDGGEAVTKTGQLNPDVVLMDIAMPGVNGLKATEQIKDKYPDINVLILTVHDTDQYLKEMLKVGASGYLIKATSPQELISSIRAVAGGDVYLYPSVARMMVKDYVKKIEDQEKETIPEILTRREKEVLIYIAEDKKNKEIASLLGISIRTVQTHRTNLMDKIGAHDRTELVKYAINKGLITF